MDLLLNTIKHSLVAGKKERSIPDLLGDSLSSFDKAVKMFLGRCAVSGHLSDYVTIGSGEIIEAEEEGEVLVYSKKMYRDTSRFYMDSSESLLVPYHSNAEGEKVVIVPDGGRYRWSNAYVQLKRKGDISLRFLALFLEWSLATTDCLCIYDSRHGRTEVHTSAVNLLELELPDIDTETQRRIVDLRDGIRRLGYNFSDRLMGTNV